MNFTGHGWTEKQDVKNNDKMSDEASRTNLKLFLNAAKIKGQN